MWLFQVCTLPQSKKNQLLKTTTTNSLINSLIYFFILYSSCEINSLRSRRHRSSQEDDETVSPLRPRLFSPSEGAKIARGLLRANPDCQDTTEELTR